MATAHPLKVLGAPGSPYSRKLRAALRFRRLLQRLDARLAESNFMFGPFRPGPIGARFKAATAGSLRAQTARGTANKRSSMQPTPQEHTWQPAQPPVGR
jgi:hypothetical protein